MSIKRRATTDLNHENWDQEEKDEQEMGSYKIASDDVLEKRVIRTAKRRFQNLGDEVAYTHLMVFTQSTQKIKNIRLYLYL